MFPQEERVQGGQFIDQVQDLPIPPPRAHPFSKHFESRLIEVILAHHQIPGAELQVRRINGGHDLRRGRHRLLEEVEFVRSQPVLDDDAAVEIAVLEEGALVHRWIELCLTTRGDQVKHARRGRRLFESDQTTDISIFHESSHHIRVRP